MPRNSSHIPVMPYLPSLPLQTGRFGPTGGAQPGFFGIILEGRPQTTPVVADLTALTDGQRCHVVLMPTHFTFLRITRQKK